MALFSKLKPHKVLKKAISPLGVGAKRKPAQGKGPTQAPQAAQRSAGSTPLSNRKAGGPSAQGYRAGPAATPVPKPAPPKRSRRGLAVRRAAPSRPGARLK